MKWQQRVFIFNNNKTYIHIPSPLLRISESASKEYEIKAASQPHQNKTVLLRPYWYSICHFSTCTTQMQALSGTITRTIMVEQTHVNHTFASPCKPHTISYSKSEGETGSTCEKLATLTSKLRKVFSLDERNCLLFGAVVQAGHSDPVVTPMQSASMVILELRTALAEACVQLSGGQYSLYCLT